MQTCQRHVTSGKHLLHKAEQGSVRRLFIAAPDLHGASSPCRMSVERIASTLFKLATEPVRRFVNRHSEANSICDFS